MSENPRDQRVDEGRSSSAEIDDGGTMREAERLDQPAGDGGLALIPANADYRGTDLSPTR